MVCQSIVLAAYDGNACTLQRARYQTIRVLKAAKLYLDTTNNNNNNNNISCLWGTFVTHFQSLLSLPSCGVSRVVASLLDPTSPFLDVISHSFTFRSN